MANTALPDLTAGAAVSATDLFYTTQGGNSRKVTATQLQTFVYGRPPLASGNWYNLYPTGTLSTGAAAQNNVIHFTPFFVQTPITISDLGIRINTLGAGGNVQIAIYASSATTGKPTGAALAVTPSITTAASGVVSADITGANVTLQPGWYYGATNTDNATALFAIPGTASIGASGLAGSATLAAIAPATSNASLYFSVAQSFNTWPDVTASSFSENASSAANGGMVFVKSA